jgi:transcriptional regulator with XRE-family HTH domain
MLRIVRKRESLVSTTGFRQPSGEGTGAGVSGRACVVGVAGGRTVAAAAVTDARGMTKRGSAPLPGRGDAGRTELAERLLASQRRFAGDVLRATTPLLPAGRNRRQDLTGLRPGVPGPACPARHHPAVFFPFFCLARLPPPATLQLAHCPAASRSRFAADLLTILSIERKGRNYGATVTGTWNGQTQCLGAFIRNRRKLARLSLRQLAEMTSLSNPYLSQLERGLHLPSVRVLKLLSEALNVSVETLLAQAGLLDLAPSGDGAAAADGPPASSVESAISADERLADEQKAALIAVYRSMFRP